MAHELRKQGKLLYETTKKALKELYICSQEME